MRVSRESEGHPTFDIIPFLKRLQTQIAEDPAKQLVGSAVVRRVGLTGRYHGKYT